MAPAPFEAGRMVDAAKNKETGRDTQRRIAEGGAKRIIQTGPNGRQSWHPFPSAGAGKADDKSKCVHLWDRDRPKDLGGLLLLAALYTVGIAKYTSQTATCVWGKSQTPNPIRAPILENRGGVDVPTLKPPGSRVLEEALMHARPEKKACWSQEACLRCIEVGCQI